MSLSVRGEGPGGRAAAETSGAHTVTPLLSLSSFSLEPSLFSSKPDFCLCVGAKGGKMW